MIGTGWGGQCYTTAAEAAAVYCGSMHGVDGAGVLACQSVPALTGAGAVTFTAGYEFVPSGGGAVVSVPVSVALPACETYGLDYWDGYIGAWVGVLVAVLLAKAAYAQFFGTPTHA